VKQLSGPHKRNTTAIQEKILVLQLHCSCVALERITLGLLFKKLRV